MIMNTITCHSLFINRYTYVIQPSQLAIATHCALFSLALPATNANAESSPQTTENNASMERIIVTGSRSSEMNRGSPFFCHAH
jgi:hypothetical protein